MGGRLGAVRAVAAPIATGLACLLVLAALLAPNQVSQLTPSAFMRIPLEALFAIALVLALPVRAGRIAAAIMGALLGLLTLIKVIDMGFFTVLARQFDPVLDWIMLDDAISFLTDSIGRAGAVGAAIAAALLAIAVLALMTLAALRINRLVGRHRTAATRVVMASAAAWVAMAMVGAQIIPGVPLAADSATTMAYDRAKRVRAGLQDREKFAEMAAIDAFRDTPGDQMLTGLRGKDVLFTFIESYGRDAVEDPEFSTGVGAVLADGNRRLKAAGFASKSAFLTSSTTGGYSWLAHSTFLSGLWIKNQQRYRTLVASDRQTLTSAFRRASWRTVAVEPGVTYAWPEGDFYGYDQVYDSRGLGYNGPAFGWATMPDQFTLEAFQRAEHSKPDNGPLMAEITLVSSHIPWAPLPRMVEWDDIGDGTIYGPMATEGDSPDDVWKDPARVRAEYRKSIEYSLTSVISYVEKYGDDDLVLVFLGDHQPAPIVTGENASRDVPITIVARDPAVLDQISEWGWQDGLRPGPLAPVTRMDTFRDQFLTAYGSKPQAGQAQAQPAR